MSNQMKKFNFFDLIDRKEKFKQDEKNPIKYTLKDVTPIELKSANNYLFLSVTLVNNENNSKKESKIIKVLNNQIYDEYQIFSKDIYNFEILNLNGTFYIVAFGSDLIDSNEKNLQETEKNNQLLSTSLKIFDITKCLENENSNKPIQKLKINVLLNEKSILTQEQTNETHGIDSISAFAINSNMSACVIGTSKGDIILINTLPSINFLTTKDNKDIKLNYIKQHKNDEEEEITNLKFNIVSKFEEDKLMLFYTTKSSIYYSYIFKNLNNITFEKVTEAKEGSERNNFCIGYSTEDNIKKNTKIINIESSTQYFFEFNYEKDHYALGPSNGIEGKKKYFILFKENYYVYITEDFNNNNNSIINNVFIYDSINKIIIYHLNENLKKIYLIHCDEEFLYILIENMSNQKMIYKLKEKENKEKFDIFYKKFFFDTAENYAKNLGYEEKKVSEINKRYAEHLFQKQNYEASIMQFEKTINYLDPSYVIQRFLEGSKLDYLIKYLEKLTNNNEFRKNCNQEQMKDYTRLLLNCYIKQKKINNLKTFIENKNINDEVTIKTAIDVCKDTKEIELALTISKEMNMTESYIQILMDVQNKYDESLDYISKIESIYQCFNLLLKYGEKFLQNSKNNEKVNEIIENIIKKIIFLKSCENKPDEKMTDEEFNKIKELKYEKIISIYISKESQPKLAKLLELIMEEDKNCPISIVHRRIELYVDDYVENKNSGISSKNAENISNILKDDRFKNNIDKNYLLMLFKVSNYNDGITALSEYMNLNQDLNLFYMEAHDYKKLIELCEKNDDINYWIQALNYFIGISHENMKNFVEENVKIILDKLKNNPQFNSMILLQIISKHSDQKYLEFGIIKDYLLNWLENQQKELKEVQTKTENNNNKIESYNNQINDLITKSKTYSMQKCAKCNSNINLPYYYFTCGHAFHVQCLGEGDDEDEIYCHLCFEKMNAIDRRILDSRNISSDHNAYFTENKKNKTFGLIAKYFGKGIFLNEKKDEGESNIKNEDNQNDNLNNNNNIIIGNYNDPYKNNN